MNVEIFNLRDIKRFDLPELGGLRRVEIVIEPI
jgi:hypothetical protein